MTRVSKSDRIAKLNKLVEDTTDRNTRVGFLNVVVNGQLSKHVEYPVKAKSIDVEFARMLFDANVKWGNVAKIPPIEERNIVPVELKIDDKLSVFIGVIVYETQCSTCGIESPAKSDYCPTCNGIAKSGITRTT